jgi:hypothetical protein
MKAAKTPETGAKGLYVSKKSRQNQDLPMTENQKHRHGGLRAASRWSAPKASRLDQKALCLKEEQARPKPSYEGETKTPPWGAVAASRWSAPNASKPDQRTLRLKDKARTKPKPSYE